MERVKISKTQELELNMLINTYNDIKLIVKIHKRKQFTGKRWVAFPSINDLTVDELESALYDGYDVVNDLDLLQQVYAGIKKHSTKRELELDLDYQLLTLHEAIESGDEELKEKTKNYLNELQKQLKGCS